MGAAGAKYQVERLARRQQVALADDFVDGGRAQGLGQGRRGFRLEQVVHAHPPPYCGAFKVRRPDMAPLALMPARLVGV